MSGSSGIVTFDYTAWQGLFPEFATTVTEPQADNCFSLAQRWCDNTPISLVPVLNVSAQPVREPILNLITAHVAQLLYGSVQGTGPAPPSGLVGRISNASEGSVSVATDFPSTPSNAWWNQTKYGAMAWSMMAPFRAGRYIVPPQIPLAAQSFPFALGGWGWR